MPAHPFHISIYPAESALTLTDYQGVIANVHNGTADSSGKSGSALAGTENRLVV